jgi:AAA domain
VNDFNDAKIEGQDDREATPELSADDGSASAQLAREVTDLRGRIKALDPDAIVEIAREARIRPEQVIAFRDGAKPFHDDAKPLDLKTIFQILEAEYRIDYKRKKANASSDDQEPAPEAHADTTPEPPAPGYAMTILDLFDAGWGKRLVPVTPPSCQLSPTSKVDPKNRGKAPGAPGPAGWFGVSVNDPKFRCRDLATAEQWTGWTANAGFVAGDGYVALDNDQGEILSGIIARVCLDVLGPRTELLRRFVASPGHKRDAYLLRVVNFVGDPVAIGNRLLKFECTGVKSELQVLARSKQFVVAGAHPGTGAAYVLSKRVTSLADIPCVSAEQFAQIVKSVTAGMQARGWALVSEAGRIGAGPKSGAGAGAAGAAGASDFEEVAWILSRLPNRHAPAGEETAWDEFLDSYDEYIKVLYAIFGALGDTPEVTTLALEWANGRAQIRQAAESAWASVINNPVRSGIGHLKQLAQRFIGAEYTARGFPDDNEWIDAQPGRITRRFKSLAAFLAEYEPQRYIVDRLLAAAAVYLLTGKTGHAKTAFAVISALAVVTGRQDLLGVEVSQGRVAYLSFENPDDVRMRFAVAAHKLNIDPNAVGANLMVLRHHASPEEVAEELKRLSSPENGGPFSLVIVDTLQAAFDGSDFNQNKEVPDFVKRQRRLTALPGKPCVLIAAHPIKNANKDSLVPYGGGAILNEADDNLTIWKADDVLEVHWQGKWRGLDFDPKPFELELNSAPRIVHTKGRLVPIPVLLPLTAAARAAKDRSRMDTRTALLQALIAEPGLTQAGWAITIGRDRAQVNRGLKDLAKDGLVVGAEGKWSVTAKGQKHVAAAVKRRGGDGEEGAEGDDENV